MLVGGCQRWMRICHCYNFFRWSSGQQSVNRLGRYAFLGFNIPLPRAGLPPFDMIRVSSLQGSGATARLLLLEGTMCVVFSFRASQSVTNLQYSFEAVVYR
jgi:hypothetical protein